MGGIVLARILTFLRATSVEALRRSAENALQNVKQVLRRFVEMTNLRENVEIPAHEIP